MSSVANWSYTEGPATVWPQTETDDWGQPLPVTPYLIPATDYTFGGDVQRDAEGVEFVPRTNIYFEASFDSPLVPKRGWRILPGDHTALAQPPAAAEIIRKIDGWPMEKFGADQLPDWRVST